MREQTEAMRLPRFLWVPFELGRPFGAPNEPDFQRRVLHDALALLERTDGPVVLSDFPDDAPTSEDDAVWACSISFAPKPSEEPEFVQATLAEIGRLAPWAEGAKPLTMNSEMGRDEIADFLGRVAEGADVADVLGDRSLVEVTRLTSDDLRTWYLQAARRQPGRATTEELNTWFWRETVFARLLGRVAARLRDDPDPIIRTFALRAVVPRDHMAFLIPDSLDPEQVAEGEDG